MSFVRPRQAQAVCRRLQSDLYTAKRRKALSLVCRHARLFIVATFSTIKIVALLPAASI